MATYWAWKKFDFALAIGGEAGQGIATPGDILARIFVRRGLHLYTYNAYQSIIRGGHIFLTIRVAGQEIHTHGDKLDLLVCLNQDTMDRHLGLMGPGSRVIFNSDAIKPGEAAAGVQFCPIPVGELTESRNKLVQNTVAVGAVIYLLGLDFQVLEDSLRLRFQRQGQPVIDDNVRVARAGFDYASENFQPFPATLPSGPKPLAVWSGNEALAMGGAAAGVKWYSAYPMSPATGGTPLDGPERSQPGHHGSAGRGRNRRGQHGHRRSSRRLPGHVCDLRWRIRPDD